MGISCGGRLRRLALVMSLGVLAALAIAGATSARVDDDVSGSPSVSLLEATPDFVTFCHVAGRAEDPANTVTLTLPSNAVFGQGGHFNEDGTPQAGHEQDHLGACETPPTPTDVCPNIDGNQAEIPEGLVKDEQGNCVTPPPAQTTRARASGRHEDGWHVLVQGLHLGRGEVGRQEPARSRARRDGQRGVEGRRHADRLDRAEHRRGRHDHRREPERHGGDGRGSHGPASRHDCLLWWE